MFLTSPSFFCCAMMIRGRRRGEVKSSHALRIHPIIFLMTRRVARTELLEMQQVIERYLL